MARDHDIREIADVQSPAVKWARAQGWLCIRLGKDGWPDYLFIRAGRVVFIEFKRPGGERKRRQEKKRADLIREGQESYFCETADQAIRILRRRPACI